MRGTFRLAPALLLPLALTSSSLGAPSRPRRAADATRRVPAVEYGRSPGVALHLERQRPAHLHSLARAPATTRFSSACGSRPRRPMNAAGDERYLGLHRFRLPLNRTSELRP